MIDFSQEQAISLTHAARDDLLGQPVHLSTIHRWRQRGIRGVKLETAMVGGRRMTSRAALERFLRRVNDAEEEVSSATQPVKCRDSSTDEDEELDALGI